jgi:hypothetical protein
MKYYNDEWVLSDEYGLGGAGDVLARIALEAQAPFTIAVTGKWGSGKTSVLRRAFATLGGQPISQAIPLLEQDLQERNSEDWDKLSCKIRVEDLAWNRDLLDAANESLCVWFSPWQHQSEQNPLIPLLLEIQQQFSTKYKVISKGKSIARQGALATLTLFERVVDGALSIQAGKSVKIATGATEAIQKSWRDTGGDLSKLSDGQRLHLLFEDAVKNILTSLSNKSDEDNTKNARLIVFIDDLDRCEEQAVVSLLEAIKLYLGTQRCIFVLGIDDTALLGALSRVWKERSEDDNREYLEKLLQTTLPVPLPRPDKVTASIAKQLQAHDFPAVDACAKIIELLLEPNPRKIKNFTNSLCSCWSLFQPQNNPDEEVTAHFIMFHYLRLYHRPIWRLLERQPIAQRLLYAVLSNKVTFTETIDGISDLEEQRMMISFMQQAFAHVLKQDGGELREKTHHGESLADAICRFQQRQDRKRSDEYFANWFRSHEDNDAALDHSYLYLPDIQITDEPT